MIRLSSFEKDNKGHRGASRISYGITFLDKELSILNHNEIIFDRVLSSGDKSALALAFFLSKFKGENFEPSIIFFDECYIICFNACKVAFAEIVILTVPALTLVVVAD